MRHHAVEQMRQNAAKHKFYSLPVSAVSLEMMPDVLDANVQQQQQQPQSLPNLEDVDMCLAEVQPQASSGANDPLLSITDDLFVETDLRIVEAGATASCANSSTAGVKECMMNLGKVPPTAAISDTGFHIAQQAFIFEISNASPNDRKRPKSTAATAHTFATDEMLVSVHHVAGSSINGAMPSLCISAEPAQTSLVSGGESESFVLALDKKIKYDLLRDGFIQREEAKDVEFALPQLTAHMDPHILKDVLKAMLESNAWDVKATTELQENERIHLSTRRHFPLGMLPGIDSKQSVFEICEDGTPESNEKIHCLEELQRLSLVEQTTSTADQSQQSAGLWSAWILTLGGLNAIQYQYRLERPSCALPLGDREHVKSLYPDKSWTTYQLLDYLLLTGWRHQCAPRKTRDQDSKPAPYVQTLASTLVVSVLQWPAVFKSYFGYV